MTPQQKQHVRDSFALIAPNAEWAAALFYVRLFEIAPHLRALFHHSMDAQGRKLMHTLAVAVAHLDKLHTIVPTLQQLGRRHVRYGVQADDYDVVGEALLWTLGQGLGEGFSAEIEQAWTTVYSLLANTMKDAAYAVEMA